MIYRQKLSDGYVEVADGPCQLRCSKKGTTLFVIHSTRYPESNESSDFVVEGNGELQITLGSKPCFVKVSSEDYSEFSITEV